MKLFIEHILDEIEKIGLKNEYRVSLSSTKNKDNYLRGFMQYFDKFFDIHYVIMFSFPEENPKLNYIFWVLDRFGNQKLVEGDGSKDEMMDKVKDVAIKEIPVNLTKGADIRNLLETIEDIVKAKD